MTLEELRQKCSERCSKATNGKLGVRLSNPIYKEVVEGRDPGAKYSSCGDLAMWMWQQIGLGSEPWLNRAPNFVYGVNVNRLMPRPIGSGAGGLARYVVKDDSFETGDVIVMAGKADNSDAHVAVVKSFDGKKLVTWDYGQGPMAPEAWAGKKDHIEGIERERAVLGRDKNGRPVLINGKTVKVIVPLAAVHARLYPTNSENLS